MTVRLPAYAGTIGGAYEKAVAGLTAAGATAGDIVHVVEYATAAALGAYGDVEAARSAAIGGHRAPVATVAVEALPGGEDLAVELTAYPGGGELIEAAPDEGMHRGALRVAGGIVYLPSIHPRGGDFRSQYRQCLEQAGELLKAAGLGLGALVQTTDYTASATRAEYPRCGRPRKELLGSEDGVFPGAAGIIVDQPVMPGAMVSLDAIASTAPLRTVNPGWKRYDTLTYKPGVAAGDTLFMSGFGALEPATQKGIFDGDLLAQAEYTYAAIAATLREAGLGDRPPYGCVTRLVEYITPAAVERYAEVAEIRRRYFGDTPAISAVVCTALLRPDFMIEVVPTAVFP
ncbi:RidA family protein [Actinomadura xylanilytica]|uniref:RidA family protein n=1 Tax=Actinomadura xylanilytica TaxID=887459 RepID=UPI00255AF4D8|nr:RidA family protein [Actinomadura xylanilytica]MDL4772514.1 RidA family protein [Actinomadura xylanilytica]